MRLNETLFEDIENQLDPEKFDSLEYNLPDYDTIIDQIVESWDSKYEFDSDRIIDATLDSPAEYPELIHPTEDEIKQEFEEQAIEAFCYENGMSEETLSGVDKLLIANDAIDNTVLPEYDQLYDYFREFEEW